MRNVLVLGTAAAIALLVWAVVRSGSVADPAGGGAPVALGEGDPARMDRLDGEVRRLTEELARVHDELASVRRSLRALVAGGMSAGAPSGESPRALLARYARSFEGGGEGSEYFRLGVDAFATALKGEIIAIVLDPSAEPALRYRLALILGTVRFEGDREAQDALLSLLGPDTPHDLVNGALQGLAVIGDASAAGELERKVRAVPVQLSNPALLTLSRLLGPDVNVALRRLFATAPDDGWRAKIMAYVDASDPRSAEELFRAASRSGQVARLAAAQRLTHVKAPEFVDLLEELLAREDDEAVKAALRAALSAQKSIPSWHPTRATGPADVDDVTRDHPNAWASASANAGREWLELNYDPPRRANAVRIHEVCSAGGVAEIEAVDAGGGRTSVWKGTDPTASPGVFEVAFDLTAEPVAKLRVILDTRRASGWNEIDAVELLGPDGRAWAKSARASSWYGQR